MSLQKRLVMAGLLIAVIVIALYSNTLANGFVIDDRPFVEQNPLIRDLANVPQMFTTAFWESTSASVRTLYRPLVTLSFALNYAVGGLDPVGYHLVNVLLHATNSWLLFAIGFLLTRRTWFSGAVAVVFAVHPINTETVAWVAQRSELMAALFSLLALLLYILAFPAAGRDHSQRRRVTWLALGSLTAFVLGLLSKEGAIALLGAVTVYDLAFRSSVGRWTRLVPYLALTVAYVAANQLAFGGEAAFQIDFVFNPLVHESTFVRSLTGVKLLGVGLFKLAWPMRLAADYSFNVLPVVRNPWDVGVLAAGMAALALGFLLTYGWRRYRVMFLGLALLVCYAGLLFVNAIHPTASMFAERFLYMPSVGFALAGVALADLGLRAAPRQRGAIGFALLALVVLTFSVRTRSRNFEWHDNFTLFTSAVAVNPRSAFAQASLASEFFAQADYAAARLYSMNALEIHPEYARAHMNLGDAALAERGYDEAVRHLSRAVELSPQYYRPHVSLGVAYKQLGNLDAAEEHYNRALAINPNSPLVFNNLANLVVLKGDRAGALTLWQRALAIDPLHPETLFNLAVAYERMGQLAQARAYYRQFLDVAPPRMESQRAMARAMLAIP